MKLDNAKDPYAMYLPGFNGYLNSRFFTDESQWRKRTIWGFDNRQIASIEMNYAENTSESFTIKSKNDRVELFDVNGEQITEVNVTRLHEYLAAFRKTTYEGAIVPTDGIYSKMDSIKAVGEIFTVAVTPKTGETITLKAYRIKAQPDTYDINNQPRKWDPDRYYGIINDERYVLVQNFGLQNILRVLSDFKPITTQKTTVSE